MKLADKLQRLRPRDDSAAAAAEALALCEADLAAAQARVADMEARRQDALLDLPANAAAQFEADLATVRADAERLVLLRDGLRQRSDEAQKAGRVAAAEAAFEKAEHLTQKAVTAMRAAVPAAIEELAKALEAERLALAAIGQAKALAREAGIYRSEPDMPLARLIGRPARLRDSVYLPNVTVPWRTGHEMAGVLWALHPHK